MFTVLVLVVCVHCHALYLVNSVVKNDLPRVLKEHKHGWNNLVFFSFYLITQSSRSPSLYLSVTWWNETQVNQECPQVSHNSLLSTLGVQWTVLPGDYGRPLWHWGVGGCREVLSVSQRQSRDLPCSVEPQKRAPPQPPARSALSDVVLLEPVIVSAISDIQT